MTETTIVIPFVNPPVALAAVLAEVMDDIMPTIKWERCGLVLAHADTGALEFLALRGMNPAQLLDYEFQLSHEIIHHVFSTRVPLLTHNALFNDRYYHTSITAIKYRLRSVLVAPLIMRDKAIGVLYCDCALNPDFFRTEDFEPFGAIANRVADIIGTVLEIDSTREPIVYFNQQATGSDEGDRV